MELGIAIGLVLVMGGWIVVLKRQVADLTDQVAILEANQGIRKAKDIVAEEEKAQQRKPGIQMYTIE